MARPPADPPTTAARSCPRTGRSRSAPLDPGGVRPSDMLVAFFACAVTALALATVPAALGVLTGAEEWRWIALHLVFLGGVSQLVLGAAQFFVCAFLATSPPRRALLRAQLVVWNAGVVAIAAGVPLDVLPLTAAGGTAILAGLVLLAAALRGMERRSLQRAPWATRWYLAGAGFLATGAVLGPLMAADAAWAPGSLLAAHLVLNLGGWFGAAIIGTLHTFYPSLTGTRLRHPQLQRPTSALWCAGIAAVALAAALDVRVLAVAGWVALTAAGVLVMTNLVASARAATRQTGAGLIVGAAQLVLSAALAVGLVLTLEGGAMAPMIGPDRVLLAILAVGGWVGLTVLGSLLHLLGLMERVRALRGPAASPALGWRAAVAPVAAVVGVDLAVTGLLLDVDLVAAAGAVALGLVYAVLGARVVGCAVRAVRAAPLRV